MQYYFFQYLILNIKILFTNDTDTIKCNEMSTKYLGSYK